MSMTDVTPQGIRHRDFRNDGGLARQYGSRPVISPSTVAVRPGYTPQILSA